MVRLETTTVVHAPIERCFDLARSVEVHLAGNVHWGEAAIAAGGVTSGLIGMGQSVTWRAKHFGLWHNLTSEITAMEPPTFFRDRMLRGPFRRMEHDHFFRSLPDAATEMRDVFIVAAPIPIVGQLFEITLLRRYMQALLDERNAVLKDIAESADWQRWL